MANTKSAEKRIRQSAKRNERNRAARSAMRTAIKKVRGAVDAGDGPGAETALRDAVQLIDRTVTKNVVHRNTAARTKSRLVKAGRGAAAQ